MIAFDRSERSVVAVCQAPGCGARDVFTSQAVADSWALHHLAYAHPENTPDRERAITAARVREYRRRH